MMKKKLNSLLVLRIGLVKNMWVNKFAFARHMELD